MFLTEEEQALTEEYLRNGYIIRPIAARRGLDWVREKFVRLSKNAVGVTKGSDPMKWLNMVHEHISTNQLNDFRLEMIAGINAEPELRQHYFQLARPYLNTLVGNELAMQLRINLSIQIPGDESSLLSVHADTWSGDSPFEVVVWVPLVDCYGTKAMYLLPPDRNEKLNQEFPDRADDSSETLYQNIASEVRWLEINYGDVLIFNQNLPHGNRTNAEDETRWSMNCRFKGVFTPYGDKKLGEFFEPITLRAASRAGMEYQYPEIK